MPQSRVAGLPVALVALFGARAAAANEEAPPASGTLGGVLVGAEVAVLTQSVAGVRPAWAWALGTGLGVGVGGYVGYRIERGAVREASLYLLATGLALAVPTAVWLGRAHGPRAEPGRTALLHHSGGRWSLGFPAVELRPVTGLGPVGDVRAPLVGGTL